MGPTSTHLHPVSFAFECGLSLLEKGLRVGWHSARSEPLVPCGASLPKGHVILHQLSKECTIMSRSLNKVMLIGNVGNDPDVRTTSSGTPIANMSLATTRKWKDGSGEQKEKTEWHRLTVWGKLVDVVERYVKKGDRLYVEGRIEYSESESDGQKKYWTNVNVLEMVMLGGATGGGGGGSFQSDTSSSSAPKISEPDEGDIPF